MKYFIDTVIGFASSLFGGIDYKWLFKQGAGWTFLLLVLWWVASYMILPMQTAHLELVHEVAKNNTEIVLAENRQTTLIEEIRDLLKR